MAKALALCDKELEGMLHRAVDDAWHITGLLHRSYGEGHGAGVPLS